MGAEVGEVTETDFQPAAAAAAAAGRGAGRAAGRAAARAPKLLVDLGKDHTRECFRS